MWSFDGGFSIPADASGHLAIEYTWIYKPSVLWNRIAGNNEGIQRWNHRSFTKVWLFSQQSLKGMCVCLKIRYPKFTGSSSVSLWRVPRLWANPMSWNQSKSWSTVGLGSAQGLLGKRLHGAVHRWRCFVSRRSTARSPCRCPGQRGGGPVTWIRSSPTWPHCAMRIRDFTSQKYGFWQLMCLLYGI